MEVATGERSSVIHAVTRPLQSFQRWWYALCDTFYTLFNAPVTNLQTLNLVEKVSLMTMLEKLVMSRLVLFGLDSCHIRTWLLPCL